MRPSAQHQHASSRATGGGAPCTRSGSRGWGSCAPWPSAPRWATSRASPRAAGRHPTSGRPPRSARAAASGAAAASRRAAAATVGRLLAGCTRHRCGRANPLCAKRGPSGVAGEVARHAAKGSRRLTERRASMLGRGVCAGARPVRTAPGCAPPASRKSRGAGRTRSTRERESGRLPADLQAAAPRRGRFPAGVEPSGPTGWPCPLDGVRVI